MGKLKRNPATGKLQRMPNGKLQRGSPGDGCCCNNGTCSFCSPAPRQLLIDLADIELKVWPDFVSSSGGSCGLGENFQIQKIHSPSILAGQFCLTEVTACDWRCVLRYPFSPVDYAVTSERCSSGEPDDAPQVEKRYCDIYFEIQVQKIDATTLRVYVHMVGGSHVSGGATLFDATVTVDEEDCVPLDPIANEKTAFSESIADSDLGIVMGKDGTATLSIPESCVECDENGCYTTLPAGYTDTDTVWFKDKLGAIVDFPPGTYDITYRCGAVCYDPVGVDPPFYSPPESYSVNNDATHGYRIVDEDEITIAEAPGSYTTYDTQAEVEDANKDAFVTITHAGGPIGIKLEDDSPLDNIIDTFADPGPSSPTFQICEGCINPFEVSTSMLTDQANVFFDGGANFAAGTYRVRYIEGAGIYSDGSVGPAQGFRINAGGYGFYIVDHTGGGTSGGGVLAPGDSTEYATQALAEAANRGLFVDFHHDGGLPIGIRFWDDYTPDNAEGSPSPRFQLCLLELDEE